MENDKYFTNNTIITVDRYQTIIKNELSSLIKHYNELGNLYEKQEKFMNAIVECYIHIIKFEPSNYVVLNQIGFCYFKLKKFELAIEYFKKVIEIQEFDSVYRNIGNAYLNLCGYKNGDFIFYDYKNALKYYLLAYKLNENCEETNRGLGTIYYSLGEYKKSIESFSKTSMEDKKNLLNMSFSYLASQNFKKGFELYNNRLLENPNNSRTEIPEIPYWNGVDYCEKLLVIYEQGIGDNIQFYRFIIDLSKKYPKMKISFFCLHCVAYIFKEYENIRIVPSVNISEYNYKIFTMCIPKILNLEKIEPNKEDYILLNNEKIELFKNKITSLSNKKKPTIGFACLGLIKTGIEKNIPIIEFHKQFSDLDINLICIQRTSDIQEDLKQLPSETNITHFNIEGDRSFEDIISILKNVDLLITIDTYLVHLAGVLNIPTWLLVGISDWRWSTGTNKTCWYDSVEIIRKNNMEDNFNDILITVKDKLIKYIDNY